MSRVATIELPDAKVYSDPADRAGYQLAHSGIADQVPTVLPTIRRYRDPKVRSFAERQGDRLVGNARSVYITLSEFIDPSTGSGVVTAAMIADVLDRAPRWVERILREISQLDAAADYFSREYVPLPDEHGRRSKKHTYQYTLPGLDSDWKPTRLKGEFVANPTKAERLEAENEALREQLALLQAQVNGENSDIVRTIDREKININVPFCDIDIDPDEYLSLYPVQQSDNEPEGVIEEPSPPPEPPEPADRVMESFATEHFSCCLKSGQIKVEKGFHHLGGAMKAFRTNPQGRNELAYWQNVSAENHRAEGEEAERAQVWAERLEHQRSGKEQAESEGAAAFRAGQPCEVPSEYHFAPVYGTSWKWGWMKAQGELQ